MRDFEFTKQVLYDSGKTANGLSKKLVKRMVDNSYRIYVDDECKITNKHLDHAVNDYNNF